MESMEEIRVGAGVSTYIINEESIYFKLREKYITLGTCVSYLHVHNEIVILKKTCWYMRKVGWCFKNSHLASLGKIVD